MTRSWYRVRADRPAERIASWMPTGLPTVETYCSIGPYSPVKRGLLLAIKLAVSTALLVYLLSIADLGALVMRVRSGDMLFLAAAVVLYLAMLGMSTWRWRLLLNAQGFPVSLRYLSSSYLVASFFNNFLPSNIGGDIVRVRDGSRLTGSTTTSLAVVAIDRIVGLGALYFLALAAYAFGGPTVRHLAGSRAILLGLAFVFGGMAYLFFMPGTSRRFMAATGLASVAWIREQFETVQAAVHVYRERVGVVWIAFAASVALQAMVVWYYYAIA